VTSDSSDPSEPIKTPPPHGRRELFSVVKIGEVHSCFKQKFGTPRQPGRVKTAVAELVFSSDWQPEISLRGLENFSHLWVLFLFHQNTDKKFHAKVHPPRLRGESSGVFSTRSPHRPNPLGLSVVKILRVLEKSILVSGVDLIDGTPLVDIKPYLPHVESFPEARAQWIENYPEKSVEVEWSKDALENLEDWVQRSAEIKKFGLSKDALRGLVIDTIAEDPRPLIYRGFEGADSKYRNEHAFLLFDGDIHFQFVELQRALVLKIQFPS
jgi:tRNA-Thr(GGU) m(6)t(6)A37 methyltransferase TsaA